jgi:patatin-like phospholipase/acyl hydrolase
VAAQVRVLSIDGGGIRGIIPALVLAEIEDCTRRPVSDLFDLIAGTSTGGLLALALSRPGDGGGPAFSARELVDLYLHEGPRIFSRSIWRRIRSADSLIDEKYPADALERALDTYLGEVPLSAARTNVLITAYEIERRFPFFFKSARARTDPEYDYPMRAAARATSAAPTYFEPYRLVTEKGENYFALIDGGVFANNPAMCAFAEVKRADPAADCLMVSLGTGELTRRLRYDEAKDWGRVEWVRPVIDVMFDGVSDTVDYQLRQLLRPESYFRLQTRLDQANDDLDDASEENLRSLRLEAERLIDEHRRDLDALCGALARAAR